MKVIFYLNKRLYFPFQEDQRLLSQNQEEIISLIKKRYKEDVETFFIKSKNGILKIIRRYPKKENIIIIDSCLPYFADFFKSSTFLKSTLINKNGNFLFRYNPKLNIEKHHKRLDMAETFYNPHIVLKFFLDTLLPKIKRSISLESVIEKGASITGEVIVERNVKILQGAIVKGPTIIRENTIIGNNVLVRNSYIDKNCVVGFNTEIARSYIGIGCNFHTNFIGDSLVGDHCYFGFCSSTSNIRLDEKPIKIKLPTRQFISSSRKLGCFIGRNCGFGAFTSIMPGITIGKECICLPMIVIRKSIPDKSFIDKEYSLFIKQNRIKRNIQWRENLRQLLDKELE